MLYGFLLSTFCYWQKPSHRIAPVHHNLYHIHHSCSVLELLLSLNHKTNSHHETVFLKMSFVRCGGVRVQLMSNVNHVNPLWKRKGKTNKQTKRLMCYFPFTFISNTEWAATRPLNTDIWSCALLRQLQSRRTSRPQTEVNKVENGIVSLVTAHQRAFSFKTLLYRSHT